MKSKHFKIDQHSELVDEWKVAGQRRNGPDL